MTALSRATSWRWKMWRSWCARVQSRIPVTNVTKGFTAEMKLELTERQRGMILAGGLINMISQQNR